MIRGKSDSVISHIVMEFHHESKEVRFSVQNICEYEIWPIKELN